MNLWLITIGEPWPTDGDHPRLHRTGVMALHYAERGDQVTWFNSTFDHRTKTDRDAAILTRPVAPGLTMIGLHGPGYHRNVSLARIRHHRHVAAEFLRITPALPRPDVIVASMPPLELSSAAVALGRRWNVPVVVDIRDLWPDIFLEVVPEWSRGIARHALAPFYRMLRNSVDGAAAVVGISDRAVDWALRQGSRERHGFDGSLPMAYALRPIPDSVLRRAAGYWDALGVGTTGMTAAFVGTLSHRIELDTLTTAAAILARQDSNVQIVIAGGGECDRQLRDVAAKLPNVVMPGWLDEPQIAALLNRSRVGLLPYPSSVDFIRSVPNKVFDYLSAGTPIVTSLSGVTADLLQSRGCGWTYPNNDGEALAALLTRLQNQSELTAAAAKAAKSLSAELAPALVYGAFRDKLHALVAKGQLPRVHPLCVAAS